MHKMGNANIKRGKKWTEVRAKAVFENMNDDVKWIDSQESIIKDMAAYAETIKQTKSKDKK